jgi:Mo-dependent nitrogenase C-terminus
MKVEDLEKPAVLVSSFWTQPNQEQTASKTSSPKKTFAPFSPIRQFLDNIEIDDSLFAHFLCQLIPSQCPFERKIALFGRTILSIPPLCKLNPFYEQLMTLRFRAICYLADECGEDISNYC